MNCGTRWSPGRAFRSRGGDGVSAGGEPIWVPAPDDLASANVSRFARWLTQDGRARLTGDYLELWRWSMDRLDEFWAAVWDYFGVRAATPYQRVLSGSVMPDVQWFTGAQVPDEIIAAPSIPHTRTGKKLEIPVKRILQGGDPGQVMEAGAVDNPDALQWFAAYQTRTIR